MWFFRDRLIAEAKHILYQIMHFGGSGKTGRISAVTVGQYAEFLRALGRFAIKLLDNNLASGVTITDLLSNVSYMKAYLDQEVSDNNTKRASAVLGVLNQMKKKKLGFIPCSRDALNFEVAEDKQQPVIPTKIYIAMMTRLDELIDAIHPLRENIKDFILCMDDKNYGKPIVSQKVSGNKPGHMPRKHGKYRPTMKEAIIEHGLDGLSQGFMPVPTSRRALNRWLQDLQYVAKSSIHFYTGMRDQEASRIKHGCAFRHAVDEAAVDEDGVIIDASRMISIISTTTKFTGYQMSETWIAPDCALKAVEIAQSITEGLSVLYGRSAEECPLFLSPRIVNSIKAPFQATTFKNTGERGSFPKIATPEFYITQEDLDELSQSDPDRDFSAEEKFNLGALWPVSLSSVPSIPGVLCKQ